MKKRILFLSAIILFDIVTQSCTKVLSRKPLDTISDDIVWDDPNMVAGYVTELYSKLPLFAFEYGKWYNWTDEASTSTDNSNDATQGSMSKSVEVAPYFDYTYIRNCNVFFQRIETSTISEGIKNQLKGEVHFIRAFSYFEMMKRYGGVPLVDSVLDPYGEIDGRYTVRTSEEAVADFIDAETTLAADLLSETPTPKGRA
ncbi:MAG TPA: RagB/SusD family nutrient uptake outer membrane protein, partial [Flavitalea sp.]|nr:RagB/SusD family nutrient uptake outer membrane protein [Flavitalea sp.]